MSNQLESQIAGYQRWREDIRGGIEAYQQWLDQHGHVDIQRSLRIYDLLEGLRNDRLVLAFLAEYSRGKTELIKPAALAQSHLPIMQRGRNPISGAPSFYGLGWDVEYEPHGVEWTHAGAFSVGARTVVKLAPQAHLGIVVLANAFPTGAPDGLADIFFGLVIDGQANLDRLDKWNALYGSLFEASVKAIEARDGTARATETPSPG